MKETVQAFLAGLGCTPILAVGLFITGAFVGQFFAIQLPAPPQWLLTPALLLPVFLGLYLRATVKQKDAPHWLDVWRRSARRRKVVGQSRRPTTVENVWVEHQLRHTPANPVGRVLDNTHIWGWGVVVALLALAYICVWFGLAVAGESL